jgi:hypothetical protein
VRTAESCLGPSNVRGPGVHRVDERTEAAPLVGQAVLGARRAGVEDAPLEHSGLLELREPCGKRPWWDALERLLELVEPDGPGLCRGPENREHPAPPEKLGGAGDILGQWPAAAAARRAHGYTACSDGFDFDSSASPSTSPSVITGWKRIAS